MALGDLLFQENGKLISSKILLESVEPTAEISGMGNFKYKDVSVTTHWTTQVTLKNDGKSYSKGRGIMYADNNEVATYTISGISKQNSQTERSSMRGMSMVSTDSNSNSGKLSSLNDIMAVYELEQDKEGNYNAKVWEWR
jgi:hypothetical protein